MQVIWLSSGRLVGAAVLAALAMLAMPPSARAAGGFDVRLAPEVAQEPLSGRVLLMLSRTERFRPGENGTPIFGLTVDDLAAGTPVLVDAEALGHPVRSLGEIPAGEYWVQAYLNVYTTFNRSDGHVVKLHMDQGEGQNWRRSPGNLYSTPRRVRFDPAADEPIAITIDRRIPELPARPETAWVKRVMIESPSLTAFWGRPMHVGATVLLPKGFHENPDMQYPVVYMQGHFSSRAPGGFRPGSTLYEQWMRDDFPRMLLVTIQHANPYYDDSYGVNSDNVGPYGDAIVGELMPQIETRFRAIQQPYARLQTGGSTGGWISLAQQVWYPDVFGGVWSFFPDQVDFRYYQIVNILEDANAYFIEHEWSRVARPGCRASDGNIRYTMEQENLYEEVIGDRCRGGGQWGIWNAVFAPVADDGYPLPIWDPLTGAIDHDVARRARDRYDIRHYLERNWSSVGPSLVGKIHVYCGRMDNYHLEEAVYLLEAFLETTTAPRYDGTFAYGDRAGHGWSPFDTPGLLRAMAEHVRRNAPDGASTDWYAN